MRIADHDPLEIERKRWGERGAFILNQMRSCDGLVFRNDRGKMTTKRKATTRSRSAKTGRMVTKAYAKKHKATIVSEKREEVLWRGWAAESATGSMPWMSALRVVVELYGKPIRIKVVRA